MDNQIKKSEVDRYYADALSWDQNRVRSAVRGRNLAWIVAGASSVLTALSVAAVVMLTPLKKVEAFVIKVDNSTGATEVVTALKGAKPVTYDEAVSKFFISEYVRTREGWIASAGRENFMKVTLLSTPDEQKRWSHAFDVHTPNSPQTVYGLGNLVDIKIHSVSFINASVAQVHYSKIVQGAGTQPVATNWVSVLTFTYSTAPESEADRLINPLGFQVSTFRSDPEA